MLFSHKAYNYLTGYYDELFNEIKLKIRHLWLQEDYIFDIKLLILPNHSNAFGQVTSYYNINLLVWVFEYN